MTNLIIEMWGSHVNGREINLSVTSYPIPINKVMGGLGWGGGCERSGEEKAVENYVIIDQDDITMREKWGRFEGNCGGAIPKSSCRTRLVLMTMTGTTMRT
ncbi:hypothetical protein Tco_0371278 [Tanacetum coccineum]